MSEREAKSLREKIAEMSPERRAEIEAEARRLLVAEARRSALMEAAAIADDDAEECRVSGMHYEATVSREIASAIRALAEKE